MAVDASIDQLHAELIELANAQFESPQYRKVLAAHYTRDGARDFEVQRTHFVKNRRDCWGFVQGAAPLEVKRLIWKHEQEELMGSPGVPDHITLGIQEAELVGLGAGEFEIFRKVIIPLTVPHILTALRVALGVAWATLVASELIAAQRGLGAMIQNASTYFLLDVIYVGIIYIGCIALIMDMILRRISARLLVWQERAVA